MRRNVSFDFDGVLHIDIIPGTLHPLKSDTHLLTPNYKYIDLMFEEHKNNDIYIVSARPIFEKYILENFTSHYKLPVKEIYCINGPKKDVLLSLNIIRHYDDNYKMIERLKDTGIEFIFVDNDFFSK